MVFGWVVIVCVLIVGHGLLHSPAQRRTVTVKLAARDSMPCAAGRGLMMALHHFLSIPVSLLPKVGAERVGKEWRRVEERRTPSSQRPATPSLSFISVA